MNPCIDCRRRGNCPAGCKPRADYIRHMKKINRIYKRMIRRRREA